VKPRILIAGAGQTGRELAVRLQPNWDVVLLDKNPAKLEILKAEGAPSDITCVDGDATSALVLKHAGIESAYSALSVMGWDEANLEFCRLASQVFRVPRVTATAVLRSWIPRFEEIGVEVISRPNAITSVLQSRVERGMRTTSDVGLGKGEILEVKVLPHSPAVGKRLEELHPQSWLVGAIYRKSELVVPHGDTKIRAGDGLLLIGEPAILPAIADYFRTGTSEFPLQYGSRVLVANPGGHQEGHSVHEAFYLARTTKALGLKVLLTPEQDANTLLELCESAELPCTMFDWGDEHKREPLGRLLRENDCGCLVLPAPPVGLWERMGIGGQATMEALDQARQPCLIARGTYPYRRILVTVSPGPGAARAVEMALDVARVFSAGLTACAATPPALVVGEERGREIQQALQQAVGMGALYSVQVDSELLEGNPIHQILDQAGRFDLLVLAHRKHRPFHAARPDISRHLLMRAPCSVLVLPFGEEEQGGG
jgi:hypothetical protein